MCVYACDCRLIAVLESMDNGKSIRESRDCDVPLVARHFYHHSGNPLVGVVCLLEAVGLAVMVV